MQRTQQPKLQQPKLEKIKRKDIKQLPLNPNQRLNQGLLELVKLTLGNGGLILSESLYFMCKFITDKKLLIISCIMKWWKKS